MRKIFLLFAMMCIMPFSASAYESAENALLIQTSDGREYVLKFSDGFKILPTENGEFLIETKDETIILSTFKGTQTETPTSIKPIQSKIGDDGKTIHTYSLSGYRLKTTSTKGKVYIRNGKKYVEH